MPIYFLILNEQPFWKLVLAYTVSLYWPSVTMAFVLSNVCKHRLSLEYEW